MKVYDVASTKWAKNVAIFRFFCLLTSKLNGQRKAKLQKKVKTLTLSGRGPARILYPAMQIEGIAHGFLRPRGVVTIIVAGILRHIFLNLFSLVSVLCYAN